MKIRGIAVIFALSLFAMHRPAIHGDDGWAKGTATRPTDEWFGERSNINDKWFGPRSTSAAGAGTTPKKNSMSSWLPWSDDKPNKKKPSKRKGPSMMQKVTDGTKTTWGKTVSFLNPFDNKPASKPVPKEDPFKPASVNDFLKGEMP